QAPRLPQVASVPPASAPLQVTLSSPTEQARVENETVALAGLASGGRQVRRVVVSVNGLEVSRQEPGAPSVAVNLPLKLREGQNTVVVTVTDADGVTQQEVRTVIYDKPKPVAAATGTAAAPPPAVKHDTWAVIIGVGRYQSAEIPSLRYTVADAESFHQILVGPGGFKKEHVLLITDKTEKTPTLRNIKWALGTFLARSAKKDDTVLIF